MEADQGIAQRCKLRVPAKCFDVLLLFSQALSSTLEQTYSGPDAVRDEVTIRDLASIGDQYFQLGVLVQYLLNTTIVAALLRL